MILQIDPEVVHKPIRKFGCYFFSTLWHIEQFTGRRLTYEQIMEHYCCLVQLGYMDNDCYINSLNGILEHFGMPYQYTGKHEPASYLTGPNELEILKFERERPGKDPVPHFVAGDGCGQVAFDPYGNSRTVREGSLASKRILRKVG
jgi:hypothetical protein